MLFFSLFVFFVCNDDDDNCMVFVFFENIVGEWEVFIINDVVEFQVDGMLIDFNDVVVGGFFIVDKIYVASGMIFIVIVLDGGVFFFLNLM